ncbi:nephronectin isoform X2 [Hemibagrus wyckioides]|uniref:nephronectin isoform X2 n=1 Tax=Hemibagrus wyckioides TaxID=337641 RepID=UPI00266D8D93|nr:nephronectin isoform X2 [Hemibagrus wyckioides]
MEEKIPGLLLLLLLLSGACVPDQVLTEHRWDMREMSTGGICRYGNRVDCCWGWTRESWGQCKLCELGCKHGECVGPDQCRCHKGYTGKTCNQDVNECGLKPRPCKHRCMNMVGSYKCYCLTGYMLTHDGICRNTQTCAMANCQYGCAVMKGVVMCQCPSPGLRLGPDRRTCVDIDECVMGVAKCPRFRKCVNTFGSYICKCHTGFELRYINGKYQCTDKNNPCHEMPDSKKCRCKLGTRGWSYDCKSVITVTVDPARPFTTPSPATKITIATLPLTTSPPTTTKKPARTTVIMTTTTATTTSPTTTTTSATTTISTTSTTTTTPTTFPTSATPTTVAMTTAETTVAMTTAETTVALTTAETTVAMTTELTTVLTTVASTTAATVPTTTAPTTVASTVPTTAEIPTTVTTTTIPTTVTMTTNPTTVATTGVPTTTTMATISTTLDNRIQEITQRPRGDVHIPRNPEQNVFELDFDDIELGNTADFARDDPAAGSLSCSFDQGVCSWMTDREGDLRWETVTDPRGGRYLTVPEPKTGRSFRGARLTISLAPPTTPPWKGRDLCLIFRHRLQGLLIGSLQVFVKKGWGYSPAVWTRTGGQGWRHTQVTLWGQGIESVVFKGERRKGQSGEIAIDDVSIHKGVCSNTGQD